jgi:hypothetical protein
MVKDLVRLRGCFRLLFLYDVAEAIDLGMLQNLLGTHAGPVERPFPKRTPQYVRFENVPIVEPIEPLPIGSDRKVACSIKYYAFGVVVVQVEIPFDCDWQFLLSDASGIRRALDRVVSLTELILEFWGVASSHFRLSRKNEWCNDMQHSHLCRSWIKFGRSLSAE